MRHGPSGALGFDHASRTENIRRVAHVARLFADAGAIAVVSLVSPFRDDRLAARRLHDTAGLPFVEVFGDTPLEECARRDPKGLYARARAGRLTGMTGENAPCEPPEAAEIVIRATRALASAPWWRAVGGASWRSPDGPGSLARPDHPVVHVSHADALAFCEWAGASLPTEPEWEAAARAGAGTRYPWGDEWDPRRANSFRGDFPHGSAGTVPVDAYEPNDLGLHNVVGNVWEWTAEQILRGGSYLCHPSYCRRNQLSGRTDGEAPMGHIGFRVTT